MILLDTHTWIWHVQGDKRLPNNQAQIINENESAGLGVSMISLWEIAKAVKGKIKSSLYGRRLAYSGIRISGFEIIALNPTYCC